MDENFTNHPYYIYGEKLSPKKTTPAPRTPIEEAEGANTTLYPRDDGGKPNPGGVSLTQIEVIDLLSEGEIEGLVTGEYTYVGSYGNVGWTSATLDIYPNAPNQTVNWVRSIYWNEVPVVNTQNQYNFTDVDVQFTPGLPNGSIAGKVKQELTYSRPIGERLRYGLDFAKTYRVLNKDCRTIQVNVKVGQLSATSKNQQTLGDLIATSVQYQISKRPIYSTVGKIPQFTLAAGEEIKGKISFGYIRSTDISLLNAGAVINDPDFLGWEIKIYRATPDATESSIRNQTYIDSITEVYGDVFTYPLSAIVASRFSAEYFSQVPNRAYDTRLLKVKIPSNYDPILKTYAGTWDGTFKDEKYWTDNPAWCYYDLVTNRRYGLGKYIDSNYVDKWSLYNISRYCDTLVSNGEGGLEPRFTCNLIINSREDAYKVINDMASIFRAMNYYGAGSIFAVQDAEKTPLWQFTNANVENGDFLYSSSSRRARNTIGMVRYNDKNNFYKPAVEYVEDLDGIRKYGIREIELTAFGCTSRGQAVRYGRWALLSESNETESVVFTAGTEGAYIRPGDIIQVFDANRHEARYGGRLENATSTQLTLDSYITGFVNTSNYKISVLTPTFNYDVSGVTDLNSDDIPNIRRSNIQTRTFLGSAAIPVTGMDSGVRSFITLPTALDTTNYDINGKYVWLIENSGNASDPATNVWDYFRAVRIEEQEDGVKYTISAIEYNQSKFAQIESGLGFEQTTYSNAPLGPINLVLSLESISQNSKIIDYRFTMPDFTNVAGYLVYVKLDAIVDADIIGTTNLIARLPTSTLNGTYIPSQNGKYCFRVYAVNGQGTKSTTYATNCIDVTDINPIRDIIISSLQLQDDDISETNPAGNRSSFITEEIDPIFSWQVGLSQTQNIPGDFQYRITFRKPSQSSFPSAHIYQQITGYQSASHIYKLEFTGNKGNFYDEEDNIPGPFRKFDMVVEAMTTGGESSAGGSFSLTRDANYSNPNGYDILFVNNPPIDGFDLNTQTTGFATDQWITPDGDVKISIISGSAPEDLAGGYVYTSVTNFTKEEAYGFTPSTKDIKKFEISDVLNNMISVSPNYINIDKAYVTLSLFDTFDEALKDDGVNIATGLYLSPIALIEKRGIATKKASMFSAWVELRFDPEFVRNNDTNWANNFNISAVNFVTAETDVVVYDIKFTEPFTDINYTIFNGQGNLKATAGQILSPIIVKSKRTDGFTVAIPREAPKPGTPFARIPYDSVFFGVLTSV